MSSNNNYSYSSSSYSYSSSTIDGKTAGQSYSQKVEGNPSGTTVTKSSQTMGEPARQETRHYDAEGRQLVGGPEEAGSNRITDAEQAERDREYEERIEEEYAKREGGA